MTLVEEVPDVLHGALLGQLRGVVLAVVVEALLATDVAHRRLGDDHALEAPARLGEARVFDLQDGGQLEQVAHRHDAHQTAVVDHREVAVPMGAEADEGIVDAERR